MYGSYNLDPIDSRAVQRTSLAPGRIERKKSVLDYRRLKELTGVGIFDVGADVSTKAVVDVLKADADAIQGSGKYIDPQKPQLSASGVFPDTVLKVSSIAGDVIGANNLVKSIGTGALVGGGVGLATSAVNMAEVPTGDAMSGYLASPEGKMRMSNDPEFSTYVLTNHADVWKNVVSPVNPVNEVIKATAAGAARGALGGALTHAVRDHISGL